LSPVAFVRFFPSRSASLGGSGRTPGASASSRQGSVNVPLSPLALVASFPRLCETSLLQVCGVGQRQCLTAASASPSSAPLSPSLPAVLSRCLPASAGLFPATSSASLIAFAPALIASSLPTPVSSLGLQPSFLLVPVCSAWFLRASSFRALAFASDYRSSPSSSLQAAT